MSRGYKVAFGYNEDNEPIPEQIRALAQAAMYIQQGCSMQSARNWLVKKTGREITVPGLLKAIKYDKSKRASSYQSSEEES